ncbi:MAG: FliA/WhiG family RNA polymerase sigma factor [Patescibacteria group bacterium]|jgi:RNA polymerase sigma factor for flagellar operon FliA
MSKSQALRQRRPEEVAEAKDSLILRYCDMVKYIALRLVSRLPDCVQVDDLFNAGIIGLIDAIDKFDVSQDVQFETYARIRIRGAMLDEIRSMDWIPRSLRRKSNELEKACVALEQKLGTHPSDEQVVSELGISIEEYYKLLDEIKGISLMPEDIHEVINENKDMCHLGTESDELFEQTYRQEIKARLTEAIGALPEKEQLVLTLYYYEELTMKEVGVVLGYTESRISQIHTKSILKLRTCLARKFKRDDLPGWVGEVGRLAPVLVLVPKNGAGKEEPSPPKPEVVPPAAVSFGQRLSEHLAAKRWSPADLARRAECTMEIVQKALTGEGVPSEKEVRRMTKAFGITCDAKKEFFQLAGVDYYK